MELRQASSDCLSFKGRGPHHVIAVSVSGTKWNLKQSPFIQINRGRASSDYCFIRMVICTATDLYEQNALAC